MQDKEWFYRGKKKVLGLSTQNKTAMTPMTPATPKLLRVRPMAPPVLPLAEVEGVGVPLVELEREGKSGLFYGVKRDYYLPPDPGEVFEGLDEGFPVPEVVGTGVPVLGGALTLLVLFRQELSPPGWMVTISE